MTISILVPALVCIVGALLYVLTNSKLSELGRLAFVVGLLVLVSMFAQNVIRI